MMIEALLCGTTEREVIPDYLLGELLSRGRVQGFSRASGWVVVGRDPIRKERKGNYSGAERRRRRKGFCLTCPDMIGGECVNSSCPEHMGSVKVFALS